MEGWGTWSIAREAKLCLPFHAECVQAAEIVLKLRGFLPLDGPQEATILFAGVPIRRIMFETDKDERYVSIMLVPDQIGGRVELTVQVARPTSPRMRDLGADDRTLGVGLQCIDIVEAASAATGGG